MINLYRFYNDIFSKFQFSITGYSNIGRSLDNYFNIIARNSFFFEQKEMLFISFAFAQLKENSDGLINWETTSLNNQKKFLFHCFHSRQMEVILDLYYSLRGLLSTIDANGQINADLKDEATAEVIAKLFNNFPSFRIVTAKEKNVVMEFEQRKFLWTFHIPIEQCLNENKVLNDEFNKTLQKVTALEIEKQKFSIEKNKNTYEWKSENPSTEYKAIRDEFLNIFNSDSVNSIRKELVNQIKYFQNQHKVFFEEKNIESNINHWANSIIAGAFLSFVFNAYMEYIPGVSNVEEGKNRDQGIKFKSLGAMIIGYDKENPIDNELRTLFRIMSDRISSAIAGNYLKNEYEKLSTPNLSEETSSCYGIEGVKEITHGGSAYFPAAKTLEHTKAQIQKLQRVFEILEKTEKDLKGIDEIKQKHLEVIEKVNALTEYNGTLNSKIQTIRNGLEVKCEKIQESITALKNSSKIKYVAWDCSELSAFVNPIEILKLDIEQMLDRIIGDTKGLKLSECSYTIYSKIDSQQTVIDSITNNIKRVDNYIIFMHSESDKINTINQPNWLENLLKKNIRFIGEFFYSYMDNGTRKYFDINLNEADALALTSLKEVGTKLTAKLNGQSSDLPIWYVFKFKTSKQ